LLTGDSLLGAFARASIRPRALAADRQAATMTNAAVAANVLQARDVLRQLPPQLSFDGVVLVQQRRHPRNLVLMQFASFRLRIDARFVAQLARDARSDAIQILQRDERRLIGRNVDA